MFRVLWGPLVILMSLASTAHADIGMSRLDGNNHQIDRISKEVRNRKVNVTVLVDCVHVLDTLCLHCTLTLSG